MKPYYTDGKITIYHGDCRDVLPTLDQVDHVITDPPYSEHFHGKSRRAADKFDDQRHNPNGSFRSSFSRSQDLGFASISPDLLRFAADQFRRVCRRWCLVFSDVELSGDWRAELSDPDKTRTTPALEYVRTGAWVKLNATPQFTGDRPASGFEAITIVHPKGKKRWNGGGRHGVWTVPIVQNRGGKTPRLHTTQKPEKLMRALVLDFTDPNDLILDAFAGSGTTLLAAKHLGRRAVGIEMSEAYCETIARRLEQEVLDLEVAA